MLFHCNKNQQQIIFNYLQELHSVKNQNSLAGKKCPLEILIDKDFLCQKFPDLWYNVSSM